jgi:23S rRNA-/tRNA-specific pseudouridylate synthase
MLVFENEHVMVIDKPCGIPTQMGTGLDVKKITSVDLLANAYMKGTGEAYLVHRLD